MKTVSLTFSAGESKTIPSGNYFHILSNTDPVNVTFYGDGQTPLDESGTDIEAGYHAAPKNGFNKVVIYSATAQTIKIGHSRGTGGYLRTIGTVDLEVGATLDSVTQPLNPHTIDNHFGNVISNVLQTIVTPAANTAGVRIDNANIARADNIQLNLMANVTAPTSWSDTSALSLLWFIYDSTSGMGIVDKAVFPIIIPAGYGLYAQASAASSLLQLSVEYEVL